MGPLRKYKKMGLNCNLLKIGLFLKEMKELDCFQKNWDKFAKHNIWTELQFLKMFGLKCKNNKIG